MLEMIFLIGSCFYWLLLAFFLKGLDRKFLQKKKAELPALSIVVAARNEEANILRCLESLSRLIYPENLMEIIIVDDNSSDSTFETAKKFIAGRPSFKLIKSQSGTLKGKANAIDSAIKIARGEIIMTTDADCSPLETWAIQTASYYLDDVGVVCGFTTQQSSGFFTEMQAMDFLFLLGVASGAMNQNLALSCIGNNMSYRKSAYDEVGGYGALGFSVTEDFSLLSAIKKLKKYRMIYPLSSGALVISRPCENLKELYRQKKRWAVGGLKSNMIAYSVMASAFVSNAMFVFCLFSPSFLLLVLCLVKILLDSLFLRHIRSGLDLKFSKGGFIVFEIYYITYVLILPVALLFGRKVNWKGRNY